MPCLEDLTWGLFQLQITVPSWLFLVWACRLLQDSGSPSAAWCHPCPLLTAFVLIYLHFVVGIYKELARRT